MIFTIAPLVQEAKTRRRWMAVLGLFTGALLAVLGVFGAAMAWAGSAVAATVTTPWAREAIASVTLSGLGLLALAIALGQLGPGRPLLPRLTTAPAGGAPPRRPARRARVRPPGARPAQGRLLPAVGL